MGSIREQIKIVHYAADQWEHVCPVLRITGPAEKAGITLLRGNEWQEGKLIAYPELVSDADIIIIQRDFPRYIEEYKTIVDKARVAGKVVVYDVDDLLTELPDIHPDIQRYMSVRTHILAAIIEADAVTCSTEALGEYIKTFNPNVWVIPNYLNDELWTLRSLPHPEGNSKGKQVIIGYLGEHSHAPDLDLVAPILESILDKYGDKLLLKLWGIPPSTGLRERHNVEWIDPGLVSYRQFAAYFSQQSSDIFIAPLLDNLFNRCKSSLKFLEYSCLGVPGIYSNLPPYSSVVNHGKNGYLASTADDWRDFLNQLIEDKALRERIGNAAQATLRKNWLLSDQINNWIATFEKLIGGTKSKNGVNRVSWMVRKYVHWGDEERRIYSVRIESLEDRVNRLSMELESREAETMKLMVEFNTIKSELSQRVEEIDNLKSMTNTLRLDLEKCGSEMDQIRAQSKQQIDSLTSITNALRLELEESSTELNQMREHANLQIETIRRLEAVVGEREHYINTLNEHIFAITHSAGWQLLEVLYHIRLVVAPRGSSRERLMVYFKRAISVFKRQGFVTLFCKVISAIFGKKNIRRRSVVEQPIPDVVEIIASDEGVPVKIPSISVVIENKEAHPKVDQQKVLEWVEKQTLKPAIEVLHWDRGSGVVYPTNSPNDSRSAPDFTALCECLQGKYLCMVTPELLQQAEIFLEINLIALESESLAFTLNLHSSDDITLQEINANRLPGSCDFPFLRMVVRKEYVHTDCSLDLSKWLSERHGKPGVVGRIIPNDMYAPENEKSIPHETRIGGVRVETYGRLILAHYPTGVASKPITHYVNAVKNVMPVINKSNELPTVLVVAPFLAMGGAERVALDVLRGLHDEVLFVVVTLDPYEAALGTTIPLFRQITPYVYETAEYSDRTQNLSHLEYLIRQYKPVTLYIVNGSSWLYDHVEILRKCFPELRIANQVYDHQAGWINRYDAKLVANIDVNIGCNQRICKAYSERGVASEHIYLIENGVNLEEFDPALYPLERCIEIKKKLGLPLDKKIVTFISRIHSQKRPMDFVELARRFRHDESVVFIMVGDGPLADTVGEVVSTIGLSNFHRFPFYSPSTDIYAITDIIVLPSEYEGMPMVILEAQAMGKPVVATDVGNNRDLLEVSGGGYVIPKIGDINALRLNVKKVLEKPFDPVIIRSAISEHYSLQGMIKKYRQALLGD